MTGDIFENLLEPKEDEEPDYRDDVDEMGINWNMPIGACANCSNLIYYGQGGPTVHDYCAREFVAYLNDTIRREYRDD